MPESPPGRCQLHGAQCHQWAAGPATLVTPMTIEIEAPNWLPRLINWLAVVVLLSLGVLL